MDEEDDLIVVVVDEKDGQNHEIYLDQDVNIKVEPADMGEIDEDQQKEILQMISSGCSMVKCEPQDIIGEELDDEGEMDDVEYLPDEISSEDDFDDDFDEKEYENIKGVNQKHRPKEKRSWLKNSAASWVSYVNHIRIDNPDVEDDEEAMVNLIVEQMRLVKTPKHDGTWFTYKGLESYICNVCKSPKQTEMDAIRHYLNQHGPRYLVCLACGADFRCTTNLYKHEKRCAAPDAPLVLKARAIYIGNKARCGKTHKSILEKQGLQKRFKCNLCPATYSAKSSLMSHERLHRAERPFQCDVCSRSYTSKAVLAKHRLIHEDGAFECHDCGRTFKYKTALTSHIFSHAEVPRFPCSECPRRFTYKAALQLHVHSKHRHLPPPCACKICPKRFARMWALKDHMLKEHGLLLMTRRMFFKQLPTMSESLIKEARVVLRSEVPILHPGDIKLEYPKPKPKKHENTEPFLDEKSGQIITENNAIETPNIVKNEIQQVIIDDSVEQNIEIDEAGSSHEYLRIVLLDDSVLDYSELINNYHMNGKKSNVVVIENGKIKDLSEEELKAYEDNINEIQL